MKKNICQQMVAFVLIVLLLLSLSACSVKSASNGVDSGSGSLDVLLWYGSDNIPKELSGLELIEHAAAEFKKESGLNVNFIKLDAANQEEYFDKQKELLASKNPPDMILFSTYNQDELFTLEKIKGDCLPLSDFIEDTSDLFEGLVGDHYSAIALSLYGNILNNKLINELGFNDRAAHIESRVVEDIYIEWAAKEAKELNLWDYWTLMNVGFSDLIHLETAQVGLDQEGILEKLSKAKAYVDALPQRDIDTEDLVDFMVDKKSQFSLKEVDRYFLTSHERPVNMRSRIAFNALDLVDFSKRINPTASGAVIKNLSEVVGIGFAVMDKETKNQEQAISFAKFLLSTGFQESISSYSSKTPSLSGSVLRSIHAENLDLAKSGQLLADREPISEPVIEAYEQMGKWFEQSNFLFYHSKSSVLNQLKGDINRLIAEQIWGEPISELELREQLTRIEEEFSALIH